MARKKKIKDIGHEETEAILAELEKRIAKEYSQAESELTAKLEDYMLKTGDFSGARWKEMRDTIAQDLTNTNQIARSIAFGYMPEVYAINHNYGTFLVERESGIKTSYTLYDKHTVQRLFNDDNTFYPSPGKVISAKIKVNKDLAWNKRQVQSVLTQYVLQGESVQALAKRLRNTVGDSIEARDLKNVVGLTAKQMARVLERKNQNAAIRNARTMATGVQNAGRVDSFKRAQSMGIDLENEWLAIMDGRTRHEHRILDGQHVPVGKPFEVEGYEIEYPGDPSAEGFLVYNCRCTLVPRLAIEDKYSNRDAMHKGNVALGNMTYEEWKEERKAQESLKYKKILDEEGDKIRHKFNEYATLLDRDGKVLFHKTSGQPNKVVFTDEELAMMRGATLTHNHPSGAGFSIRDGLYQGDIALIEDAGLYKIRAEAYDYQKDKKITFELTRKGQPKKAGAMSYKMRQNEAEYMKNVTDPIAEKAEEDFKKKLITYDEYSDIIDKINIMCDKENRRWLKKNARDYGYKYSEKVKKVRR